MAKKYKGFKGSGMNDSRTTMSQEARQTLSAMIESVMLYQHSKEVNVCYGGISDFSRRLRQRRQSHTNNNGGTLK